MRVSRPLVVFGVVVAVAALALVLFRAPLAMSLMERVATQNMARDAIAELGDGLHVVLCGAGSPLPDPARSGPCAAIVAGDALVVVDAGSGAARNIARLGLPTGRIEAVLLTHFHSDHIDGLGELMMQRWIGAGHAEPLPVVAPSGVEQVVDGFNDAYRADSSYRTAHHGAGIAPPSGTGGVARPFALPADGEDPVVYRSGELEVRAFRVNHAPIEPAVGYRFDYRGRSIVISGDTVKSKNVERVAQGADVLVHEALSPALLGILTSAAESAGRTSVAKITRDILDYHTTPVEAAEIARDAGARHLLFHHIVPPLVAPGAEAAFLEGVDDVYDGPVTVGVDGTRISLPAGTETVIVAHGI
jgi:ribonuclease Z